MNYVALGLLIFVFVFVFYAIIIIHDIPYEIATDIQAGGELISGDVLEHHDRILALLELEEDLGDYGLPVGVQGRAAVYTAQDALHSSPVRRILLRMMGWLNYLYPIKK